MPSKRTLSALLLTVLLFSCQSGKKPLDTIVWKNGKNMTRTLSKKGVDELSGLYWNALRGQLYAVQDNGGLHVLQLDTTLGKFEQIAHLENLGTPEGITQVNDSADEFYTIDENSLEIRRYQHAPDFSGLQLACHWKLSIPPASMALFGSDGPEGIAFVPDSNLVRIGFVSSLTGQACLSTKGLHGLIFIAHQHQGLLWAYDINPDVPDDFRFVGTYRTNASESCDLAFDRSAGLLYILHNIDANSLETTDLSTSKQDESYEFVTKNVFTLSNPSGSNNIEGFAIASSTSPNLPGNFWLCRDIDTKEKGKDRKDCLRWFRSDESKGRQ